MKVIPVADLLGGQVVVLRQGIYDHKTVYAENLPDVIDNFLELGIDSFHIVDLDGARGSGSNARHIEELLSQHPKISVSVGGGIRTVEQVQAWIKKKAQRVIIGTAAIEEKDLLPNLAKAMDPDRIIIATDLIRGSLAYHGWEAWADIRLDEYINNCVNLGFKRMLCTDVGRDGMLSGPNLELYTGLRSKFPQVKWLASGGVSSMDDIRNLAGTGVEAVVVGKAIYDRKIDPVQIRDWNISN